MLQRTPALKRKYNSVSVLERQKMLESFKVDGCDIHKASVKFIDPDMEVECVGVGMSSSTPEEGITGDFIYITSPQDAKVQDVKGKVCLVHTKLVNHKLYKTLVEKEAAALILCCGSVYEENITGLQFCEVENGC